MVIFLDTLFQCYMIILLKLYQLWLDSNPHITEETESQKVDVNCSIAYFTYKQEGLDANPGLANFSFISFSYYYASISIEITNVKLKER